ncbi:DUF4915 domain-containing protein [Microcoleus sp. N3A4]|uniref:DUF4915 domain-containing protein n=1 Tax=Microcoleus sp. N3A4 TaxID=3055379 RepID=UPI002FD5A66C
MQIDSESDAPYYKIVCTIAVRAKDSRTLLGPGPQASGWLCKLSVIPHLFEKGYIYTWNMLYVTASSQWDVVDGWRDRRQNGGIVIDIESNDIIVRGLSMPHSPRWYRDKLWLLNLGRGELGYVDDDVQVIPAVLVPMALDFQTAEIAQLITLEL